MPGQTRKTTTALALLAAACLGGCAGDLNPVRDVLVGVGAGASPQEAAGFIEETRATAPSGYLPVAPTTPRETDPKTPEEVEALRAELEATLAETAARGDRARRLAIGPAPEPVTVAPLPELGDDPAPPASRP